MMDRNHSILGTTLPVAGIVLMAAAFLASSLFTSKVIWTSSKTNWNPWAESVPAGSVQNPGFNPDFCLSYYPRRVILAEAWEKKEWPFWNPYSFCGTPFLADIQAGVFYPVNWLLLPLDPIDQFPPFLFFHMAWGGIGIFLLMRRLGVPGPIAWGGGIAFVLNEYFVKNLGLPTFLATASWVPWVFLATENLFSGVTARRIALLSLAWALLFLAGQPQIAIHTFYAAVLFVIFRVLPGGFGKRPEWGVGSLVVGLALAAALALLLASVQLIPTAGLAARSARTSFSYATILSGAFHPVDALRMLVPDFLGTSLNYTSWSNLFPRGNSHFLRISFSALFAGTPLVFLALWGAVAKGSWRRALPVTVILLLFAALAFGTPLSRFAYDHLPGFRFSRIDRAGLFLIFAQFILAGLGAAHLARVRGRASRLFGLICLLLIAGGVAWVERYAPYAPYYLGSYKALPPPASISPEQFGEMIQKTRLAALYGGISVVAAFLLPMRLPLLVIPFLLTVLQLFQFGIPYGGTKERTAVYEETDSIRALRASLNEGEQGGGRLIRFKRNVGGYYHFSSVLPPSTNVPFHLRDAQGYNALSERTVGEALQACLEKDMYSNGMWSGKRILAPNDKSSLGHPILDLLSVRAAVTALPQTVGRLQAVTASGWDLKGRKGFRRWENGEALPRARMVPHGTGMDEETVRKILVEGAFVPGREAYWVGEGEVGDSNSFPGAVRLLSDSWNRMLMETESVGEQLLVVADTYSPGWKAEIDGSPAPILSVFGLIRGVVVPPGRHEVMMSYEPPHFRWGVLATLSGLLITGICIGRRGRKSNFTGEAG